MVQTERSTVEAPAEPATPSRSPSRPVRVGAVVTIVAVVAAAVLLVRLGRQQNDGPAHVDVEIGNGIPATLYVPGAVAHKDEQQLPDPKPVGQRPPVIVLAHGFAADRALMSTLARSLTSAGYAVVAFDFRGHGGNRNAFGDGDGGDGLRRDIKAVVDWTATTAQVDPKRLIVMGHSMGAAAVLDFATHDVRPDAVVPISGSDLLDGPVAPKQVLLIAASGDPKVILNRNKRLVPLLAGEGATVRRSVVPNTDHVTILYSGETVKRIVAFSDSVFGIERSAPATRADGRLGTAGLYLLVALVLVGAVGVGAARLAPAGAQVEAGGGWRDLGVAFAAFFLVMPLLALGSPFGFLPIVVGDVQAALFFVAGAAVLLFDHLQGRRWQFGAELRAAAPAAGLAILGIYLLLSPFGEVFHRLVPTPERLGLAVIIAACYLPFIVVLERAVRRGSPLRAGLLGALSKVLVLVALFIGLSVQLLPFVLIVILPVLAGVFVVFEVFAGAAYRAGRNVILIAAVQAALLAWITAAALPIRL
jgi:dienelactone hydrolase